VESVLEKQARTGRPFGLLAEELFDLDATEVERAWARQYAGLTLRVDPLTQPTDERVLAMVTRRQAWQFRVVPIRFDGAELMLATTEQFLRRALGFAVNVLSTPAYIVLADGDELGAALCRFYAMPGMTPDIADSGLDHLLASR
ncbi:MAG: GspE/PulE/PilB domain-containing protein, partial [Planctomycetota bacterium]|jgi:hypothetical protein